MAVVVGMFGTQTLAEEALERFKAVGFDEGELSLVSRANRPVGAPKDDEQRANDTVDFSIAGAMLGAVAGGFLLGPVGAVLGGTAAGGGVAAALSSRGVGEAEAQEYERRLAEGRYLLAVETGGRMSEEELRTVLEEAGADRTVVRQ